MNHYDFYAGLFLMGVSIGTCILASRLGFGDIHNPGAGLIPFGAAALLGLMSIGMVIRSLIESIKVRQEKKIFKGISWKTLILVLATLLGYGIAFNTLGFNTCTFLLMLILLGVVSRKKWWLTLAISILTVVSAYLIFVVWLDCQFPTGPFGI